MPLIAPTELMLAPTMGMRWETISNSYFLSADNTHIYFSDILNYENAVIMN